jgi:hypothetical protein
MTTISASTSISYSLLILIPIDAIHYDSMSSPQAMILNYDSIFQTASV